MVASPYVSNLGLFTVRRVGIFAGRSYSLGKSTEGIVLGNSFLASALRNLKGVEELLVIFIKGKVRGNGTQWQLEHFLLDRKTFLEAL